MELLNRKDWIRKYYPIAAKVTAGTGIFPETMLAMAVVESQGKGTDGNWYPGLGLVARTANNYFGIKASSGWKGATIDLPTPGDADKISTFRKYNNVGESIADFINFLKVNPRYTKAGVFSAANYPEQIIAIARAGYAENPNYSSLITSVANKVKEYTADLRDTIERNSGTLLPILIAGFLIGAFFLHKKLIG
jgi:flagellum-specific peptidoglycan hydrolase FlgJ